MEECRTERGNMDLVHREERLDDLQCKGYFIIQDPKRFCFGVDAVFLSEFTKVKTGDRVLDLGTGTGIIPILLVAKTGAAHITGLEIQQESAEMADRSVRFNGLTDRITIQQGDIKEAAGLFPAASFDVITSNPPYMTNQHGLENAYEPKNIARHEILCNLEDVIRAAAYLVKPGGSFFMIHKPFRLAEIFSVLMKYKMEPKRMRLIQSYVDKEPGMVMIEAVRGGRSRIKIEPPLIVYREKNVYTDEVKRIYEQ
ncbi:MAG: tRNA1(Val) (adenine(37)-N6)-methyltransferase [Clostridium sp.]|nr:tRNA1(Val) (adenine(37)-N6)-methyltransferase [Clostridium sp.]